MATLIPGLPKQAKLATRLPVYQLFDQNRSKVMKIKKYNVGTRLPGYQINNKHNYTINKLE